MVKSYKEQFTIDHRISESTRILAKYPDKIPVIIECQDKELNGRINKKKFLVPNDISISYLLQIIRGRIKLESSKAIFMYVDNKLLTPHIMMREIYNNYITNKRQEKEDKFLYIELAYENTFG